MGGLEYTRNFQIFIISYYIEENYWKVFTLRRENNLVEINESGNFLNTILISHMERHRGYRVMERRRKLGHNCPIYCRRTTQLE